MMPSNPRKRSIVNYVSDGSHSRAQITPHKKRYTLSANLIESVPSKTTQPSAYSLIPRKFAYRHDIETALKTTSSYGYMSGNNLFNMSGSTPVDMTNKINCLLKDPVSVTPALKFPTVPTTSTETASSEPISIASALNYPTTLIPLTAEERKQYTIQQLIAEKLRMMRRDKLVLLKSPAPNPHESEICLTVVEVSHSGETSEDSASVNYAVLQEDINDSSDLFKLVLDKISKKSIPKVSEPTEHPETTSSAALSKKNAEYARQIEKEVLEKINALRQKGEENGCTSAPDRDKHALYVMFVDREEVKVKDKKPDKAPAEIVSENDRREQQFTEIFDTIFQKLSTESNKRRKSGYLDESEQKTKKAKGLDWQEEDEDRRNKSMQGNDHRRRNLQFYPCTSLDDLDAVTIGPNGTKISMGGFLKINWWQWPTGYCTRKLLPQLFNKTTMSTHSLWGTNTDNKTLSPDKVDDLVYLISDNRTGATVKDVHQAIVSKCYSHKLQSRRPKQQETTTEPNHL